MTRIVPALILLATVLLCALPGVPAQAQPIRVFVALTGADSNPCTFASPCKSAQHAHDVVAAGGEIRMLDPGSYGLLTITKAVSILGDGHGGIAAQGGANAITVNAGANDTVNIRGVVLEGFASGVFGILFTSGGYLNVQDCLIHGFAGTGIHFTPIGSSKLAVSRTVVSDSSGGNGIDFVPFGTGTVVGVIDHVEVDNSAGTGVSVLGDFMTGTLSVTISNSVMASNRIHGIVTTSSAAATTVVVRSSTISNNSGDGLQANGAAAVLRVAHSTIAGNDAGWEIMSGAALTSYGDNQIDGNANGNTAPPSSPLK
jgi:hypothetical protein